MKACWDYIIIGAGSAGAVLANRLSANPANRVLLLDAGIPDKSPYIHFPAGIVKAASDPRLNWNYLAEPDPTRGGAREIWPAGKALGGGSSINGMIFVRGHPLDFDDWAAAGADGWDYQSVLPYFRRSEHFEGGGNEFRGDSGPQAVSHLRVDHPVTDAFVAAAEQAGHAINEDYNAARQGGVSRMQLSQYRGLRHSTAKAYLKPADRRSNLQVMTNAFVEKILINDRRADGVRYRHGGDIIDVRCSAEVVLCGGAIASPKILMLSGIGRATELDRYGIPVVMSSPQVGRNLQEHPVAPMAWHVNQSTLNTEVTPLGMLRHGLNWLFFRRGALTTPAGHAQVFFKTDLALDRPNIQAIFTPLCYGAAESETQAEWGLYDKPAVMMGVCLMNPAARGEVSLRSSDPDDMPVISHELLGHPEDITALVAGCMEMRRVFGQPAVAPKVVDEFLPGPDTQTGDDFAAYFRENIALGYHPCGTCRMGSDAEAVVDPSLCVRGIEGLRVADGSVMPKITTGNSNAPVIMIAEKAADLILNSNKKQNGISTNV